MTVSGYIVRHDEEEPKMLLHMHKKLGKLLQFGGHVELGENPWQAITHEIREGSGYRMDQLQLLQPEDRIRELPTSKLHPQPIT